MVRPAMQPSNRPFSDISPRHDLLVEMASFRQHAAALGAALLLLLVVLKAGVELTILVPMLVHYNKQDQEVILI